jgi:hypothetical protein
VLSALDSLAHLLSKLKLPSESHKDALWHTNHKVNSKSREPLDLDTQGTFSCACRAYRIPHLCFRSQCLGQFNIFFRRVFFGPLQSCSKCLVGHERSQIRTVCCQHRTCSCWSDPFQFGQDLDRQLVVRKRRERPLGRLNDVILCGVFGVTQQSRSGESNLDSKSDTNCRSWGAFLPM